VHGFHALQNKAALGRAVCCSLNASRDAECTWPQGHMKQITGCFSCDTLKGLLHSRTALCPASFIRLSTLSCSFFLDANIFSPSIHLVL